MDYNTSAAAGGGVADHQVSTTKLTGLAQIVGNTAVSGGGVSLATSTNRLIACATWAGTISPNTPNDPPTITQDLTC